MANTFVTAITDNNLEVNISNMPIIIYGCYQLEFQVVQTGNPNKFKIVNEDNKFVWVSNYTYLPESVVRSSDKINFIR